MLCAIAKMAVLGAFGTEKSNLSLQNCGIGAFLLVPIYGYL